ncbi:MAG: leucine-rich repeat domain-containing protein, partial [Muribaculaceae bacterium]|nr:leucine-rich repeat domain-containing protein [Muribaculaceae bacterium]
YAAIRENFTSVETLDLSEMENAEIPVVAFEYIENLSSVVVPDNVTAIGENAFAGCSNLESVTLGAVDAIGANAFNGCENLTSITINSNGGNAAAFRRAPRLNGIDAASFAGINPNCIIFVADENISINDVKNVVYSGSGTRHALTDIMLSAEYPFHTPGSFNLGDRSISLSVPVKCRRSTVSDNWSGIVLPFAPAHVTVDGVDYSIAATGANTLSMMTFADSDAEELSHADAVEPNVPYVVRVNDMGDAPVTALFSATGAVAESADEVPTAFDVPRTPESAELARGGKLFTICGNYLPREAAEGEYVIDATGELFELVDPEAETIPSVAPFGVVLRANEAGAPASLKIGTDDSSAIVAVAAVEADGLTLSREGGIMVITSDRARKLAIFDLSGRCVASLWLEAGRNTVELPSGIYLVAGLKIRM